MLANMLMQMASVQQFLNALLDDLAARRNPLVLLSAGVEAVDLWQAMEEHLARREFYIEEISLPDLPRDASPAVALGKALELQWPEAASPRSVGNLMISEGLPEIIQLKGFEELPESARTSWLTFLLEWTKVSKNLFDQNFTPSALILLIPGPALPNQVPESDLYLSVHYWWGFPSALEVQMLCRLENTGSEQSPLCRWREHLIPAITGNDISLAEHLWDHLHLDCDQLFLLLRAFGEQRGWTSQLLQTWGAEDFLLTFTSEEMRPSRIPSPHWYQLWTHGALNWTPEYGIELHTAALALLGRTEDLQHRLWRGQASLLLPLIDNVRLTICRHLTQRYGRDWPVRWGQPVVEEEAAAVQDNPFACQWGHLAWLLKSCGSFRKEQHLLSVVKLTHWVRNQIAHYRPIELRDFEGLWREMHHLQQKIKVTLSV